MTVQRQAKTERVWVNITPAMRYTLEQYAERKDLSISQIVRQALSRYIRDEMSNDG